ncbi:hypothetical protein ACIGXM_30850 [Kitasatospora sp. NPDC052896]|uniref:hypothetical protein n=1 Tax=Kitasatospora sp. NPDC052896 TaxID=3364061 RepID=UPI0037CA7E3B
MSSVHLTASPGATQTPRARTPQQSESVPTPTHGSTAATGRRDGPLARAVRNTGILLDTAARVVFLGRDGVRM